MDYAGLRDRECHCSIRVFQFFITIALQCSALFLYMHLARVLMQSRNSNNNNAMYC